MSKSKPIAVFDISSSSVGGAHALLEHDDAKSSVTFLVQERRDSGLDEELDIERFLNNTAKALEVVIDHVRIADLHHPAYIQVVLSSPWYSAYTRTITYSKTTLFTCTKRLVDSLIEKEIAFLLKQPSENGNAFGSEYRVVEQQLTLVKLNGYESADPYKSGKKVQSMELTLIVTLAPAIVVERFTSIIRRSYGSRTIHVTTGVHAAFVALRDNGGIQPDSMVIDVGEEVTDIAFIKNGLFASQHSFPVGTYELYRVLSAATGSTVEARALMEGYRLNKLSPGSMKTVEKSLAVFAATWMTSLKALMEVGQVGFPGGFNCPAHCYLCVDTRFETVLSEAIAQDPYLRHNALAAAIKVAAIDDITMTAIVKTAEAEPVDNALLTAALFSERV